MTVGHLEVFKRLDTDRDGVLSKGEVRRGLQQYGLPASSRDIDALFATADTNGDGNLTTREFREFAEARAKALRAVYDMVDENRDGNLTTDEIRRAAAALGFSISSDQMRAFKRRCAQADDGVVTFEAFCSCLLLLPTGVNPAAVFESIGSRIVDQGEFTQPSEAVGAAERSHLLAVLAAKVYSGSVAGAISRTATAPIDRLKTIMQAAPPGQPSPSLVGGLRAIHTEGGLAAFFRGNTANVLKIAPETSIKFLAFDQLKSALAADPDNVSVGERFVAGGGAGAVAQACVYPLEICKVRMCMCMCKVHEMCVSIRMACSWHTAGARRPLPSPPPPTCPQTRIAVGGEGSIWRCARAIVASEGPSALYRGLGTSIVGIVPYAGIDLGVNSLLKETAARWYHARGEQPGVAAVLSCGMLSSTFAMVCTYPINLVRTRLQASGMPGSPRYAGPVDVLRQAIRAGGVPALYQGILPNMLKVLPATSISYAVYDRLNSSVTVNNNANGSGSGSGSKTGSAPLPHRA